MVFDDLWQAENRKLRPISAGKRLKNNNGLENLNSNQLSALPSPMAAIYLEAKSTA